jgi:hypothetical protein
LRCCVKIKCRRQRNELAPLALDRTRCRGRRVDCDGSERVHDLDFLGMDKEIR